jgi:hypothetical protein
VRLNALAVITLFFGVWFTVLTAAAWTRGKRTAAIFLGLLAAVDLALAFNALTN